MYLQSSNVRTAGISRRIIKTVTKSIIFFEYESDLGFACSGFSLGTLVSAELIE
jgi:hypothetical protein